MNRIHITIDFCISDQIVVLEDKTIDLFYKIGKIKLVDVEK